MTDFILLPKDFITTSQTSRASPTVRPQIRLTTPRATQYSFAASELFDAFVSMPNVGGDAFPHSYKPAKSAKTQVSKWNLNRDLFIRGANTTDVLVIEVNRRRR